MRVKVALALSGAGQNSQDVLEIHCGAGQQILRWLAYAACSRLTLKRGETLGCFVPQAVIKDGTVLDVDLVLSEVVEDGGRLLVEYSTGPLAFTTRWEQRPKSPPLSWEQAGAGHGAEPTPTAWILNWDLHAEGLAQLVQAADAPPQQQQKQQGQPPAQHATQQDTQQGLKQAEQAAQTPPPASPPATSQQAQQGGSAAELERLRAVLLQHAGALQMLFLLHASEPCGPADTSIRMGLPQFKSLLQAAKVATNSVPPERVDELYTALQSAPGAMARRGLSQVNANGLDFADFLVLLTHVAHHRFAGESFLTGTSYTQLSTKLLSMLQDCICAHLFPELQRRLEKLKADDTPGATLLLKKGRRLTEQVLERCQIRRVHQHGSLRVPCTYVLKHLERWGVLGKEDQWSVLAPVVIFAKQEASDPYRFVLQDQPLSLDYDEFERLLWGIATLQARLRKRSDAGEVLGELLDVAYRKSGVLVTLTPP